jgi:hypothetical protein
VPFAPISTKMAKRELIEPKPRDKRYVRRDDKGHFTEEQDDVGRSLTQDRRKEPNTKRPAARGIVVIANRRSSLCA